MRQFRHSILLSALALMVPATANIARAQESIPALTLDANTLRQGGGGGFMQDERPTFNYSNPYLNETLILQYQNILLERMVMRQSALSRMEKSFMDVGVPFDQPPPPRGICEQLPVNVPCYKAYPDLFPGAVPEVAQIEQDLAAVALEAIGRRDTASMEAPPPPKVDLNAYRWAEITCAGGKCVAVVAKDSARRTVREGDALDDGIRVTRITATGVDVSRDGKTEALQAAMAPSRGGAASPKYAGFTADVARAASAPPTGTLEQKSQQLEGMFSKNAPSVPSASSGQSASPPPGALPVSGGSAPVDLGPPLGPTGLF